MSRKRHLFLRYLIFTVALTLLFSCSPGTGTRKKVVVLAFDGMDPGSVLFRPHGGTGKGFMLVMRWRFLDLYYLHLRPVLGRIKGKFSGGGGKG